MPSRLPFVRIAGFYACYFGAIGVFLPYLALYFRHHGFSPIGISQLMAILLAMRILAPGLWAWLADVTGRRTVLMRSAAVTAPIMFIGVVAGEEFGSIAVSLALFGIVWAGVLPQFEANTLDHLGDQPQGYGRLRLWGSLGFIVAVAGGGALFAGPRVALVPVIALAVLAMTALATVLTPAAPPGPRPPAGDGLVRVLKRPEVFGLLVGCILLQASFGTYYVFFTIYLRDLGYSTETAGFMWAWGVAAEIAVFAYTPRLLQRWSPHGLLAAALGATAIRWLVTAWFSASAIMLVIAQTLHLAAFGVSHAVAVYLVHRYFRGSLQNRGQALYSSLGFGLGGAAGSLMAGYLWDLKGATAAWIGSAVLALVAAAVVRITAPHSGAAMARRKETV